MNSGIFIVLFRFGTQQLQQQFGVVAFTIHIALGGGRPMVLLVDSGDGRRRFGGFGRGHHAQHSTTTTTTTTKHSTTTTACFRGGRWDIFAGQRRQRTKMQRQQFIFVNLPVAVRVQMGQQSIKILFKPFRRGFFNQTQQPHSIFVGDQPIMKHPHDFVRPQPYDHIFFIVQQIAVPGTGGGQFNAFQHGPHVPGTEYIMRGNGRGA